MTFEWYANTYHNILHSLFRIKEDKNWLSDVTTGYYNAWYLLAGFSK